MQDIRTKSCQEFIDELASNAPVPGGGGAAALVGAVGIALVEMAGALTVGKRKYIEVQDELRRLMGESLALRNELLTQIEADAEGFLPLQKVYGMDKGDPAREMKLEVALQRAIETPCKIMELCARGIEIAKWMAENGSQFMISDVGCAVVSLKGALEMANLNVLVNTMMMRDNEAAEKINYECQARLSKYGAMAEETLETVKTKLTKVDQDN